MAQNSPFYTTENDTKTHSPIHAAYLHRDGAVTLNFIEDGTRVEISPCIPSAIAGNMVVSPDK